MKSVLEILFIGAIIFVLVTIIFPNVPEPSPSFDCDDSTLYMYQHFTQLGLDCIPIVGNLALTGESWEQCNHAWLLVKIGGEWVAYDWGEPKFDSQHYEGFKISYQDLLRAVAKDRG